jgi:hypothetical protein
MLEELKRQAIEQAVRIEREMLGEPGSEKRAAVVDVIAGMIDIPFVPNLIEDPIKRAVIGYFVDLAVEKLNWLTGWDFKDAELSEPQVEALAKSIAAPLAVVEAAVQSAPESLDEKIKALCEKYGVSGTFEELISAGTEAEPPADTLPGFKFDEPRSLVPAPGKFETAIAFVLKYEGGYVNHPDDPGGETNLGITARTLAAAHASGLVSHSSVKNLTREEAVKIYRANYWDRYGWGDLPFPACLVLFDAAVNGGFAIIAQRTCNTFGEKLAVDGKWGPLTKAAVWKHANDPQFSRLFLVKRKDYYDNLIASKPAMATFKNGWYNRLRALAAEAGVQSPV